MNEQRVWELFKILLPIKLEDLDNPCDYQKAAERAYDAALRCLNEYIYQISGIRMPSYALAVDKEMLKRGILKNIELLKNVQDKTETMGGVPKTSQCDNNDTELA